MSEGQRLVVPVWHLRGYVTAGPAMRYHPSRREMEMLDRVESAEFEAYGQLLFD